MTEYLRKRTLYPPLIEELPPQELSMVIVIPAYDEHQWKRSLQDLADCHRPKGGVEVILLINDSEKEEERVKAYHREMLKAVRIWAAENKQEWLRFYPLYCGDLPARHAGVGMARKIGMDEACRRFEMAGNTEGIIVGFDADSRCDPDYLCEIENYFDQYSNRVAASIYYEHPLEGEEFDKSIYQAIAQYELHLRYFNNAKRYSGFPFAYETIGSAMAVRSDAYQKEGGMNRRKAGEDFYFLNKFTSLGTFGHINRTRVLPSPRPSHRVPFGTGKAVQSLLNSNDSLKTYAPASFVSLRQFFDLAIDFYQADSDQIEKRLEALPEAVSSFLEKQSFAQKVEEINRNVSSILTFEKRFFQWFNAFMIMKYVHHARDHFYPDVAVQEAGHWLAKEYLRQHILPDLPLADCLQLFRDWDRKQL